MALTLTTSPPSLVYARNAIWYQMHTDQYITAGSKPYMLMTLNSNGPQLGDTFTLTIDNTPIVLTFIGNVLPSNPFELHANYTPDPMNTYATQLLAELQACHLLSAYFDMAIDSSSASQAVIRFTSRSGEEFTRSLTITNGSSSYTAGTADSYAANYKLLGELWMESAFAAGDYRKIDTLEQVPDQNQDAFFNLMRQVEAELRHPLPEYLSSSAKLRACTAGHARFYIKYADKSGSPVTQSAWSYENNIHVAYLAGVPIDELPAADFLADRQGKALSRLGNTLSVTPDQLQYLWFFNHTASGTPQIECTVWFTDGSSAAYSPTITIDSLALHQMGYLSCGYTQLDIGAADPNKTVRKYSVRVKDSSGNYYTEAVTFILDWDYKEDFRQFLLPNGYGGYDTLAAIGAVSASLSRKETQVPVPEPFNAQASDALERSVPEDRQVKYTAAAGPFDTVMLGRLQDIFAQSGQAYTAEGGSFVPVELIDKSITLIDRSRDAHVLRFAWRYSFPQNNVKI